MSSFFSTLNNFLSPRSVNGRRLIENRISTSGFVISNNSHLSVEFITGEPDKRRFTHSNLSREIIQGISTCLETGDMTELKKVDVRGTWAKVTLLKSPATEIDGEVGVNHDRSKALFVYGDGAMGLWTKNPDHPDLSHFIFCSEFVGGLTKKQRDEMYARELGEFTHTTLPCNVAR